MKKLIFPLLVILMLGCFKDPPNQNTEIIPPEVGHRSGYVKYLTPPNNYPFVLGWITAIHDKRSTLASYIELDYIRLYARVNGTDVLINSDEYNDNTAEGGLYKRVPWFGENYNTPIPYEYSNSENLVLRTSTFPDNVWHVYNRRSPRVVPPANVERCWVEVRCKITGPALIQIGIDYWIDGTSGWNGDGVNNTEAGVSDWYYNQNEWHIMTFGK